MLDEPIVTGIITDVWHALPRWFPTIALDGFVVMPNHVHLIVWLQPPDDAVGATLAVAPDPTTPDAIARNTPADRARASPAPTDARHVGATLAVALDPTTHNAAGLGADVPDRAGASPAPTEPSHGAFAEDADRPWVIPEPETVNLTFTLGEVMGAFKSLVFTVYLDWIETYDPTRRARFWQRNYYDHIIRNERELHAIRRYIRDNPGQWALDQDNPDNLRRLPPPTRVEDYLADVQALLEDENGR